MTTDFNRFEPSIFACEDLPPDQLILLQPGEAVDIVTPDGILLKRITVRAPRIDVIYNIGLPERDI